MLMEHNPEIDWHTGDITMMSMPSIMQAETTEERMAKRVLANKTGGS